LGFLRRELIKGKALVIYWSMKRKRQDYTEEGAGAALKNLASVFIHFFTRTRWDPHAPSNTLTENAAEAGDCRPCLNATGGSGPNI
jgi:hypothetical protein